jgi:hypothetical protein
MVLGLVALIVVARVAYSFLRPAGEKNAPANPRAQHRVTLALDPSEASVQIDQLPAMRDDLFLDESSPHVLLASAPGRITRRFSILAKTDMELSLHLGRTLTLPLAADPEPLRSELAVTYPANPATRDEINRAFAKLDRYAKCLTLLGYADGDARRGAAATVPKSSDTSVCVQLVDEANTLAPEMFPLRAAATAYFQGAQNGQSPTALRRLLATFRAEFLAARTSWQMDELARQGMDDGHTAAWHLRRVALAAQAWLRQSRAPMALAQGLPNRLAQFKQHFMAFLTFDARSHRPEAQDPGTSKFAGAAQDLRTLAEEYPGNKKPDAAAALAACRRLLVAFNALVVE